MKNVWIKEKYKVEINEINSNIIKDLNRKRKMEEIIQIIERKPETLKKLDIPKLEIIDRYYKEKIIEYKKILNN